MSVRSIIRASTSLLAFLLASVLPHRVDAQSTTSLLTDGSVLPRGGFAIRVQSSWTRFDEFIGGTPNPKSLGASFSADSLGVVHIPALSSSENAIRTLTGASTFRLSAGQLSSVANSRIVTSPVMLELGVAPRLTFGVVVPIVETRTVLVSRLNAKRDTAGRPVTTFANVGPNPYRLGQSYASTNALLQQFTAASTALQTLLTNCQANPSTTGCATVNSQAPALLARSTAFTTAFASLYGTDASHPGQSFVPLTGSDVQNSINHQIQVFRDSYRALLTNSALIDTTFGGAGGPAANRELNGLLGAAGYDTVGIADHTSIGDITVGATLQLLNNYGDTIAAKNGAIMYRFAINGGGRIGTGQPANRNRLYDNSTGFGQPGAIGGAALDLRFANHITLSALGTYTANFGTVDVSRVPNFENAILPLTGPVRGTYSAGNVLVGAVTPRFELSRYFAINGQYQITHVDADKYTPTGTVGDSTVAVFPAAFQSPPGFGAVTAHQIGFGFSYSTVSAGDRSRGRIPFEVTFRHLETIAASGGSTPKTFEDQLSLRIFLHR